MIEKLVTRSEVQPLGELDQDLRNHLIGDWGIQIEELYVAAVIKACGLGKVKIYSPFCDFKRFLNGVEMTTSIYEADIAVLEEVYSRCCVPQIVVSQNNTNQEVFTLRTCFKNLEVQIYDQENFFNLSNFSTTESLDPWDLIDSWDCTNKDFVDYGEFSPF
jgi:hypothetical protein